MNSKQLIVGSLILFRIFCSDALAYFDNYPPYKFKDRIPQHLEVQSLVDFDNPEYKSKDGEVVARLKDPGDNTYDFFIQEGNRVLVNKKDREIPLPYALYRVDLDKNGLEDLIVFSNYRGCGLASQQGAVDIFLNKQDGSYQKISYDTMASGPEDFVDLDKDGRYEVIITDFYGGDKHNYFTYDIYEFKDYRLLNVDTKFKGFPKFIWFTDNPNDKDTVHLTKEQRMAHTKEKDKAIKYGEIR